MADDGLHDESGERCGEPEDRNLVGTRAKIFIDGAHVGHLQSPAELNAEEAETHVPDLPEGLGWLFHMWASTLELASSLRNEIYGPASAILLKPSCPSDQRESPILLDERR